MEDGKGGEDEEGKERRFERRALTGHGKHVKGWEGWLCTGKRSARERGRMRRMAVERTEESWEDWWRHRVRWYEERVAWGWEGVVVWWKWEEQSDGVQVRAWPSSAAGQHGRMGRRLRRKRRVEVVVGRIARS
jgi:hypothetical protein